jgi:pimeloyl-ACP methyl ester carboxylesterase
VASLNQRWSEARPTKTFLFWFTLAAVVGTIVIGFSWGGWVTSGTAQATAKAMADDAVVHRLTSICVAAAHNDPGRQQKLKSLQETGEWERPDYVKKAGWATMPGDKDPDSRVADECARALVAKQ